MTILTKPLNLSFELNPKKANKFFKKADRNSFDRVIERAFKHKAKTKFN